MTAQSAARPHVVVDYAYYAVAIFFFVYLFHYFWTSDGGPTLLAMTLVPVAFVLFVLLSLRENDLYPGLPMVANYVIAALYIGLAFAVSYYMHTEYYALGTERAGDWNGTDLLMGTVMTLLVLEYARKRHMPLFILNIILVLYAVYGYLVPGMFAHGGLSWWRVGTAMSVETATGVFSNLPQIALTVIAAFLLVLGTLSGFGCIDSLLRATKRVALRSPHALPQSAVVGSMCVGTVSGSGAANAITIGSATIPAMIGAGMPRATAAAIESASSLGGQLMPPVMGVSAFLMAEFLGKSYFEVVARGYVPALIYYVTVATSVYLLALRYRLRIVAGLRQVLSWRDVVNLAAFLGVMIGLIGMMAAWNLAPQFAALYVFIAVGSFLFVVNALFMLVENGWSLEEFIRPVRKFLDAYIEMTSDLTLLLATLAIMTGALVITGVPTKLGSILINLAGVNLAAMVILAFLFGALLGTGLPPAPTYILVAIVIAPPMIRAGVNPWVVHFFAFFLGVWGELTPPTSLVAAVTAKIANASFYTTLNRALQICVSLFTLMAGVFVHPELVIEPGVDQFQAAGLILVSTVGITFSLQATFADTKATDIVIRLALAGLSLFILLRPDEFLGTITCIPVLLLIGYWLLVRRERYDIGHAPAQPLAEPIPVPQIVDTERGRMQ
ncbi:MAG TPA: TRAP transporter fused permease subunit [Hyphomicrobiaceae bacterium]|jgi:TRAP transporter 4TM/12TM fusion protein|nr:TRAP transporter fused permease subunit [Hyphomicrobiaceae bacterium]